jgi:hypothetical protein
VQQVRDEEAKGRSGGGNEVGDEDACHRRLLGKRARHSMPMIATNTAARMMLIATAAKSMSQ